MFLGLIVTPRADAPTCPTCSDDCGLASLWHDGVAYLASCCYCCNRITVAGLPVELLGAARLAVWESSGHELEMTRE